jgi:hypothetical protein
MKILGQGTVRCKIILDNTCLQQVNNFKYLGFEISYENEKDTHKNWQNLLKYCELQTKLLN